MTAFAHFLSDLTQHVFDAHGPDDAYLFKVSPTLWR